MRTFTNAKIKAYFLQWIDCTSHSILLVQQVPAALPVRPKSNMEAFFFLPVYQMFNLYWLGKSRLWTRGTCFLFKSYGVIPVLRWNSPVTTFGSPMRATAQLSELLFKYDVNYCGCTTRATSVAHWRANTISIPSNSLATECLRVAVYLLLRSASRESCDAYVWLQYRVTKHSPLNLHDLFQAVSTYREAPPRVSTRPTDWALTPQYVCVIWLFNMHS